MTTPSEITTRTSNLQVIGRLLELTWRYRSRATLVLALQLVVIALTLVGLGLTGLAVDVLVHSVVEGAPPPRWPAAIAPPASWPTFGILVAIAAAILLLAAGRGLASYGYAAHVARLVHMEVVPALRLALYARLQRLGFHFFDAHPTGSLINRVTRDVQMSRSFIDGVVIQGAVLILTLGLSVAYMLSRHVSLTLASLAPTPLLYVVTVVFMRWADRAYREERRLSDEIIRTASDCVEGIQVIKVFGREAEQRAAFARSNQALRDWQLDIFRNVSRFTPTIDLLGQLNLIVLLMYGGLLVARGAITLGDLVVFATLLQQVGSRISEMAGIANTLQQSITGAKRVFEVLDTQPDVDSPAQIQALPGAAKEVCFDEVEFGYGGTSVLKGLSLTVPPGHCIGITGPTGAGKSSLLQLIPRFYDPARGIVSIGGTNVRGTELEALRRSVGIVFQSTFLFRDTIANNICFGKPAATHDEVRRAAELAGAHGFIRDLPRGYETRIEEGGSDLSGGQRQRLALARALLLDPPILLLDDPTSAIDPVTATQILESIRAAAVGRTTILVSSHPGVLRIADEIVLLERGRIVARGAPAEMASQIARSAVQVRQRDPVADLLPVDGSVAPVEG